MSQKQRRSLQFGMRSLFVAILLIAIGLALWRAYAAPFAKQRERLDALRKLGILVTTTAADGPAWQRWLVGEDDFVEVHDVHFSSNPFVKGQSSLFDGRVLDTLTKLRGIRTLNLSGTSITDEQLVRLAAIPKIERLYLRSTAIGDDGVKSLSRHKEMKGLSLSSTLVSDEGLEAVGQLTDLEYFSLESLNVKGPGVAHLAKLTKLKTLQFTGPSVTNEWIRHVAALPNLERVELHSTWVDDGAIPFMQGWKNVNELYLNQNRFTTDALDGLWAKLPKLQVLEAKGGSHQLDAMSSE